MSNPWDEFFLHARRVERLPDAHWLRVAGDLADAIGVERFAAQTREWLAKLAAGRSNVLSPEIGDLMRGLIWVGAISRSFLSADEVGAVALEAFRKIRGSGMRSRKLGDACVLALSRMPSSESQAALVTLTSAVKDASAAATIAQALSDVADRAQLTSEEATDLVVPNSAREARDRLEGMLRDGRSIEFETWSERVLKGRLLGPIAATLIWESQGRAGIPNSGGWLSSGGTRSHWEVDRVRLWHPAESDAKTIQLWRSFLDSSGVSQGVEQAHREVAEASRLEALTGTRLSLARFAAPARKSGWRLSLQAGRTKASATGPTLRGVSATVILELDAPFEPSRIGDPDAKGAASVRSVTLIDRRSHELDPLDLPARVTSEIVLGALKLVRGAASRDTRRAEELPKVRDEAKWHALPKLTADDDALLGSSAVLDLATGRIERSEKRGSTPEGVPPPAAKDREQNAL